MPRNRVPPTFTYPAIAVGLLALAFLYYYFPARGHREDALNRRAFRELGTLAGLMQKSILNYGTVLENWARPSAEAKAGSQAAKTELVGFSSQVPDLHYVAVPSAPAERLQISLRSGNGQMMLWFQSGPHGAEVPLELVTQRFLRGEIAGMFDEILVADGSGAVLYQTRHTGLQIANVGPLLAQKSGTAAADAAAKPEAAAEVNSTPSEKTAAAPAQRVSSLLTVNLGGADYRLYSSPAPIRVHGEAKLALDLTLYGLVSATGAQSRALSTPGSIILDVGLGGALVIFIAWPLLKFRTMRASERVPRKAGFYFFATTIASTLLAMVLCIHLWYCFTDFDQTEEKLERLAEGMDYNVSLETHQALDALRQIIRSNKFRKAVGSLKPRNTPCGVDAPFQVSQTEVDLLSWHDFPLSSYTYFDQVFWVDRDGFQQIKWTTHSHNTPATRVCEYPLFYETTEGHLWYFLDSGPAVTRFRIDPVYAPNTAEYQEVISLPYEGSDHSGLAVSSMATAMISLIRPVLPPEYGFAVVDRSGLVLFHSTAESNGREQLLDEVDQNPAVRAAIQAQTEAHLTVDYRGAPHRFFVRPLRRIQGCPWTLITFRDMSGMTALQLDRTILFLMLTVGCLLLFGLIMLFVRLEDYPARWFWPCEDLRGVYVHAFLGFVTFAAIIYVLLLKASITVAIAAAITAPAIALRALPWKLARAEEKIRRMAYILASVEVLIPVFQFVIRRLMPARFAVPALLSAYDLGLWFTLVLATFLWLSGLASKSVTAWLDKRRQAKWTSGWATLPAVGNGCTVMALSILLLIPVLPAICFVRVAYDYYEDVFTRKAQLQAMEALENRVERIRRAYSGITLAGSAGQAQNETARAQFLRARIDDVGLDRYDVVFGTGAAQVYSPGPSPSPGNWIPRSLDLLMSWRVDSESAVAPFLNRQGSLSTRWNWSGEGANHLRLRPRMIPEAQNGSANSPPVAALARLVTKTPSLLSQDMVSELRRLQPAWWQVVLPLIGGGLLLFPLFRSTVSRLFLLNVRTTPKWKSGSLIEALGWGGNMILLGMPRSGKTKTLEEMRAAGKIHYIDLAHVIWWAQEGGVAFDQKVVVLDHFEYECQDPEVNRIKLEILEELAHRPDKRVVIATSINPSFYLHRGPLDDANAPEGFAPGKYLHRWLTALAGFSTVRLDAPSERGSHDYQLLWAACSRSERVALYHLAVDGWANHRNEDALDHLEHRGLVIKTPVVKIADDRFRNYIRDTVTPSDLAVWERGEGTSVWDGLRIGFYILAVGGVVAVAIYHQQQAIALITTLLSILPGVAKLFLGRGKAGDAAGAAKGGGE